MRTLTFTVALLAAAPVALAAAPPEASVERAAPPKRDRGEFLIAVKLGGLFAQPFSSLGASYLVDLELGWALPVWQHRLAITVEGAYTAPEANGSGTNAQTTAGAYTWHLQQRQGLLGLSLILRWPVGRWTPYVGVGPRMFLLQSEIDGKSGMTAFSTSSEVSTKVGVGAPIGLGVRLGPGDLFLEFAVNWAPIDHSVTGNTNVGSLALTLGYRFVL
jgi:outer membrane protein W